MSIHIVVDGYNLIRQSDRFRTLDRQDIQTGREALIDALAAYKKIKRHKITVIFDGGNAPSLAPNKDRIKGIDVRFSAQDETADTVIKRISTRDKEKILVVSSDREIVSYAESQGASGISSAFFEEKIRLASLLDSTPDEIEEAPGWIPTTRKKGPSRRPSRMKRRQRLKTDKL